MRSTEEEKSYQSCSHFFPEIWSMNFELDYVKEGVIENPSSSGLLGEDGWFIPKHTAERDPSLLSIFGLQREVNRQKLAERFLRPTSWWDYCNFVSSDNCATPDNVASRPPAEGERDRFFLEGAYSGYFRKTEQNNCTAHPTSCTGHIGKVLCHFAEFSVSHNAVELLITLLSFSFQSNSGLRL